MYDLDEKRGETEIADNRERSGAGIKTDKTHHGFPFAANSIFFPGPALMPQEIMDESTLNGKECCDKII
jgi:hypothetical protein